MSQREFISQLIAMELLTAQQAEEALNDLSDDPASTSAESLTELLVKRSILTKFQAQRLLAGQAASLVLGNYVLLDKIGQGGMGLVLKAIHRRMGRVGALKVLPSEMVKDELSVQRFHREVQAAARLAHTNIVTAYDADESDGTHFFVMEYVDGADLSTLVKRKGPFGVGLAIDCILQTARGLTYAHAHGVIHRDIKPANLLLDRSGVVKILDMGLARIIDESSDATKSELTTTGTVMGTVDYMSPEQALNTKHASELSDQYSLGITLYYLLTGRVPYVGESIMEKLLSHRESPVPSLRDVRRDVPISLDGAFRRMLAKQPQDRFPSMSDCVSALETVRDELSETAKVLGQAAVDDGHLQAFLTGLTTAPATLAAVSTKVDESGSELTVITGPQSDTSPQPLTESAPLAPTTASRPSSGIYRTRHRSVWAQPAVWMVGLAVVLIGIGIAYVSRPGEPTPVISQTGTEHRASPASPTRTPRAELTIGTPEQELKWLLQHDAVIYTGVFGGITQVTSVENWKDAGAPITAVYLTRRSQITDADLRRLQAFPQLHTISLIDCPITSQGLSIIGSFRNLVYLDLNGTRITDDGLPYIDHLHLLTTLILSETAIRGPGLKHLVRLGELSHLDLRYLKIDDQSLRVIASLPRLQTIRLAGCDNLTDACGETLGRSKVIEINLDQTSVTDKLLDSLATMSQLRTLGVANSKCTGGGLVRLAGQVPLTNLTCVGIEIAPADAEALRAALPDSQISSSSPVPPPESDLLARINVREHAAEGDWRKSTYLLSPVPRDGKVDLLKLPVARQYKDYVLSLGIRRMTTERHGGLGLMLPVDGRQVMLRLETEIADGWGLELIDGARLSENGTLQPDPLSDFLPDRPLGLRVTVQRYPDKTTAITAVLNGREVWSGDVDMLDATLPEEVRIPDGSGWGLASWDEFEFTGITIKSLPEIPTPVIWGRLATTPWPDETPIDVAAAELFTSAEWTWSTPENAGPLINTEMNQDAPTLSDDGLQVIRQEWSSAPRLMLHRRKSREAAWRPATELRVPDDHWMHWPKLSQSGEWMIAPARLGPAGSTVTQLFQARRAPPPVYWTDWTPVMDDAASSSFGNAPGVLTADGLTLYFGSNRPGGHGGVDIWVTRRSAPDAAWTEPVPLPEPVNSPQDDFPLDLSRDERVLILSSRRAGGVGGLDFWCSVSNPDEGNWGSPIHLGDVVNSRADEWAGDLAADGRTLVFGGRGSPGYGDQDLWISRRIPAPGSEAAERYPQYIPSVPAFTFDGDNDYITTPEWAYDPTRPITIECWVIPHGEGEEPQSLVAWLGPQSIDVWHAAGHWGISTFGSQGTKSQQTIEKFSQGVRSHVAAQFDGQALQLFVDGQLQTMVDVPAEFESGGTGLFVGGIPSQRLPNTEERSFSGAVESLWITAGNHYDTPFEPSTSPSGRDGLLVYYRGDAVVDGVVQDISDSGRSAQRGP